MFKNILLIGLAIFSLMSFAYAFVQGKEADKQLKLAVFQKMEAEKSKLKAEQAMMAAEAARAEADQQRAIAVECEKNSKKK